MGLLALGRVARIKVCFSISFVNYLSALFTRHQAGQYLVYTRHNIRTFEDVPTYSVIWRWVNVGHAAYSFVVWQKLRHHLWTRCLFIEQYNQQNCQNLPYANFDGFWRSPINSVTNTKSVLRQVAGILVLSDLIAPPNPIQNDITKITSVAIGLTKQQQHLSFR